MQSRARGWRVLSPHWNFLAFEHSVPDEGRLLDHTDLEIGCLEILWRVLPPHTVLVPIQLTLCLHVDGVQSTESAQLAAAQARSEFLKQLQDRADRATLLLCPIFASNHYTLLVLERWGEVEGVEAAKKGTRKIDRPQTGGNVSKSPDEEALVFDQLSQPALTFAGPWTISYYETLHDEKQACRRVAASLLRCLDVSEPLPPRCNRQRQERMDCGLWLLYFLEEHCRRQRGELPWGFAYSAAYRIDNLLKLKEKLVEHRHNSGEVVTIDDEEEEAWDEGEGEEEEEEGEGDEEEE